MNHWQVLVTLFAALPAAAGVVATGRGGTAEHALEQAKLRALEQESGVFVIHSETTGSGPTGRRTDTFTGGTVDRYRILDQRRLLDGTHEVTIDADVKAGKDNRVPTQAPTITDAFRADVAAMAATAHRQERFAGAFESQPVFTVASTEVRARMRPGFVDVRVAATIAWSPKFTSDLADYAQLAGRPTSDPSAGAAWTLCIADRPGSWRDPGNCAGLHAAVPAVSATYLVKGELKLSHFAPPVRREEPLDTNGLISKSRQGTVVYTGGRSTQTLTFAVPIAYAHAIEEVSFEIVPWRSASRRGPTSDYRPLTGAVQ